MSVLTDDMWCCQQSSEAELEDIPFHEFKLFYLGALLRQRIQHLPVELTIVGFLIVW